MTDQPCTTARFAHMVTLLLGAQLALFGCADDIPELSLASPDYALFQQQVYPVLLRDCSFHACHGSNQRFFQALGPGRGRLSELTQPLDPATPDEIAYSYERARSMIDARHPERSLLLRKPLALAAGGSGHAGVDALGRDVYSTDSDPNYLAIESWVLAVPPAAPAPGPAPPSTQP